MDNNEPVVLGRIKKNKTGKPILVIIIFLFIGGIIFILPSISSYFEGYNVFDLIKSGEIIDFIANHDEYIKKAKEDNTMVTEPIEEVTPQLINGKTVLKYNNFTLSNFELSTKEIKFNINTETNINFDASNYYLVLTQDNKEIAKIKLSKEGKGTIQNSYTFNNELSSIIEVNGIIKEIKSNTSTQTTTKEVTTPESINNLVCSLNRNSYTYTFESNKLIKVKEIITFKKDEFTTVEYNAYNGYVEKINEAKGSSSLKEVGNNYIMESNIDLNIYRFDIYSKANYYSLNENFDTLKQDMESKGYDCK